MKANETGNRSLQGWGNNGMTELIVGTKDRLFRSDFLGEMRAWWSHGTVSGIRHNFIGSNAQHSDDSNTVLCT